MSNINYEDFRKKLEEQLQFPAVYMFKFIVKANNSSIAKVESLFPPEAELRRKESNQGKYISITAKMVAINADEIINIYKNAAHIEGLISL